MDLKDSKTKKNLLAAFAGESQARNKYTYFAQQARKENYHYIAKMFEESADNDAMVPLAVLLINPRKPPCTVMVQSRFDMSSDPSLAISALTANKPPDMVSIFKTSLNA